MLWEMARQTMKCVIISSEWFSPQPRDGNRGEQEKIKKNFFQSSSVVYTVRYHSSTDSHDGETINVFLGFQLSQKHREFYMKLWHLHAHLGRILSNLHHSVYFLYTDACQLTYNTIVFHPGSHCQWMHDEVYEYPVEAPNSPHVSSSTFKSCQYHIRWELCFLLK